MPEETKTLEEQLEELNKHIAKQNKNFGKGQTFLRGVINGIATGIGATIGVFLFFSLLSGIFSGLSNIPFVNSFLDQIGLSDVVDYVEEQRHDSTGDNLPDTGAPITQPTDTPMPFIDDTLTPTVN